MTDYQINMSIKNKWRVGVTNLTGDLFIYRFVIEDDLEWFEVYHPKELCRKEDPTYLIPDVFEDLGEL